MVASMDEPIAKADQLTFGLGAAPSGLELAMASSSLK